MYAEVNGIRLCYESQGQGMPVVMVHGLADTRRLWRYQVPVLAEHFQVITFDTRGHGESSKPPLPYAMAMYVEDLRGLLDYLGIERPVLVGLSMGGGIVQSFTLAYPDRVRALGLISTSSEFPPATRDRFLWRAEEAPRVGMAPLVESVVERWFSPEFVRDRPDEVEYTNRTVAANDPIGFAGACQANAARDWSDQLGRITCPTLYVGGGVDPAGAAGNAEIYRRHIPDLEAHIIPGVSHLLPVEAPQAFTPILLGFLKRIEAS